jgi:hypothetical protein
LTDQLGIPLSVLIAAAARRWVVAERMNSWHNRFRKLLIRYKNKSHILDYYILHVIYYSVQEDNLG